jgi:HAD superfamily hydrolase (TIGR01509 family)
MPRSPVFAVLLDVDGTLVDSNDAHAEAWVKAFAEAGIDIAFDAVRPLIGMGGDKLMPSVSGLSEDSPRGERIAARRGEIFAREYLPTLRPFRDADRLVAALKDRDLTAVVASSAQKDELRRLLAIAGVDSLVDGAASSDDGEDSKPDPDILLSALRKAKASPHEAIMIGDTPYDVEAARRAGIRTVAFRCGGWDDHALRGAIAIYDGPWDLLVKLDESPLAAVN